VAETRDPIELRSELLHILLAGRDTTAAHLGWGKHNPGPFPSRLVSAGSNVLINQSPFLSLSQPLPRPSPVPKAARHHPRGLRHLQPPAEPHLRQAQGLQVPAMGQ
jgi:hypothetical protein